MNADEKLKVSINAKQHAVDWGVNPVTREAREHAFRIGDTHGFERAIQLLESQDFINRCEHGVDPAAYLKEQQ